MSFASYSLSEWTLDLNIWDTTGEAEEESLKRGKDSDNIRDAMVFDTSKPEEVGKEDEIELYKKVCGALSS